MRTILVICVLSAATAAAQNSPAPRAVQPGTGGTTIAAAASGARAGLKPARATRPKVTYIAGDVFYLSAGRDAGVLDSTAVLFVRGGDTLAVLKVFAVSSKSSAARIVTSRRKPAVGDELIALLPEQPGAPAASLAAADSTGRPAAPDTGGAAAFFRPKERSDPGWLSLHGRTSVRYLTIVPDDPAAASTQPALSVNLRGKFRDLPLQLNVYGTFRTLLYGTSSPFRSGGLNETRITRLSLDYDDKSNVVSAGRIIPAAAPSTGYIDGGLVGKRIGDLLLGGAAGFEPTFARQGVATDYRKFLLFAAVPPGVSAPLTGGASYSRTFFHAQTDREVASAWLNASPDPAFFFAGQSDVDLRMKKGDALVPRARLTNLWANVNYRFAAGMSASAGVTASRPAYAFSMVASIPDSLLDNKLRTGPTVGVNIYTTAGLSLVASYTPRSSDEGFGREFGQYTSLGWTNLFHQGLSVLGSSTITASQYSRSNGFGGSMRKSFGAAEVSVRYMGNRYTFAAAQEERKSTTVAFEGMTPLFQSLLLWGSVERFTGLGADAVTASLELSLSF